MKFILPDSLEANLVAEDEHSQHLNSDVNQCPERNDFIILTLTDDH